jgi:hypothetical protein
MIFIFFYLAGLFGFILALGVLEQLMGIDLHSVLNCAYSLSLEYYSFDFL